MNQCFNQPLVKSVTGGKGGGGAVLTSLGKKVVEIYRSMGEKAHMATQEEWKFLQNHLKK